MKEIKIITTIFLYIVFLNKRIYPVMGISPNIHPKVKNLSGDNNEPKINNDRKA
jgi:hypothetical protein